MTPSFCNAWTTRQTHPSNRMLTATADLFNEHAGSVELFRAHPWAGSKRGRSCGTSNGSSFHPSQSTRSSSPPAVAVMAPAAGAQR